MRNCQLHRATRDRSSSCRRREVTNHRNSIPGYHRRSRFVTPRMSRHQLRSSGGSQCFATNGTVSGMGESVATTNRNVIEAVGLLLCMLVLCGTGCSKEDAQSQQERPTVPTAKPQPVDLEVFRVAALKGDVATVQRAIDQGVDVSAADADGRTALHFAAFDGHDEIVRKLLAQKANVNALDSSGRTALMYSASGPNAETVGLLLEAGGRCGCC